MKIPVNLQELLQQSESAITSISALIGQGLTLVNCTGVDSIAPELLDLLFTSIPQNWDFPQVAQVIDLSTLTDTFAAQLSTYIDQRLGRDSLPTPHSPLPTPQFLDIFQFRNEVIGDYRQYIESFLKIRDPKVKQFVDSELDNCLTKTCRDITCNV